MTEMQKESGDLAPAEFAVANGLRPDGWTFIADTFFLVPIATAPPHVNLLPGPKYAQAKGSQLVGGRHS